MSGSYEFFQADAPGGLNESAAATAAARDAAEARAARRQVEGHDFLVEHGAAVLGGHVPQVVIRPAVKTPMSGDVFAPYAD